MSEVKITIRTDASFRPLHFFRGIAFAALLILPGHFLGSAAMEWLGFLFLLFMALIVIPLALLKRDEGLSFDQARKRIDELEKEQR